MIWLCGDKMIDKLGVCAHGPINLMIFHFIGTISRNIPGRMVLLWAST